MSAYYVPGTFIKEDTMVRKKVRFLFSFVDILEGETAIKTIIIKKISDSKKISKDTILWENDREWQIAVSVEASVHFHRHIRVHLWGDITISRDALGWYREDRNGVYDLWLWRPQ